MEKGESFLKRYGTEIAIGIMFCILIFLAGMLFSVHNRLVNLQAGMEKRISELEKRQDSIEQSLGILRNIQPEIEGLHKHWEVFKEKMTVLHGTLERFIDELSGTFSREQKEKMRRTIDKLSRLWEAFVELMEELEAENGDMEERRQGESSKD